MFEKNEELHAISEKLWVELGATCQKGQLIPWSVVEGITGLTYQRHDWTPEWRHVVNKFRKRLQAERQIVAWQERGVGMKLLTDPETLKIPGERRRKRMFKQTTRLMHEFETVNPAKLSHHERLLLIAQQDRLRSERKEIRMSLKEVRRKTEVGPMRKLPATSALA